MHSLKSSETPSASLPTTATSSPHVNVKNNRRSVTSSFEALALDVSGFGSSLSFKNNISNNVEKNDHSYRSKNDDPNNDDNCELWEDFGVVEYLDRGLALADESTEDEREASMRETLASDTDILECDGTGLGDFLFHVARTKYGKAYIRIIRTMLLNRGDYKYKCFFFFLKNYLLCIS